MIDWDDIRYFLAVARESSVRAAAGRLGVNHATVLRRIAQLEGRLGAQMFEKLPLGYRLTASGEELLELANQMEASSHQLETRVFGRDESVRGLLRVTLAPPLATHLLMPDFADFARLHPEIEMEILSSGKLANLTNREADVAIRVVYDRKTLPLNLHGLKGPELFGGVYMSRDRLAAWRVGAPDPFRWIVISAHGIPDWASAGEVGATGAPFRTTDGEAQIAAARQGLGLTTLTVLHWRRRPAARAGARGGPAPVWNAMASHEGGDPQDEARQALHGVRFSKARGIRAATRGALPTAGLRRGGSQGTLASDKRLQPDLPGVRYRPKAHAENHRLMHALAPTAQSGCQSALNIDPPFPRLRGSSLHAETHFDTDQQQFVLIAAQ